jgi:hypothetical protein
MKLRRHLTLFSGLLLCAVSATHGAEAPALPTPAQAEAAMKSAFRDIPEQQKNIDALKVHKVHGCVPAFERPATDFLCVLDWHSPLDPEGEDTPEMPIPFRHKDGAWSMIRDSGFDSPACPSPKEAEKLLRAFKKNDTLRVTDDIDDGMGLFSAERGMMRDKKGPLRIMCRYDVESRISDRLAITYFWYENGKYRLDEVEDWFD